MPHTAPFTYITTSIDLIDNRLALIETISAELTVVTVSELALYEQAWKAFSKQALYGEAARELIRSALATRQAHR
ncbi:hypothetical protein [Nocardia sp. NBC_01329]|uniref:hypothetical protein n=1 Tax=Nocardia sp. NBC_01329 TaxID=2903594 RepID=UPI002E142C5B|nr:hypothetical protein OG405_15095 [Nocardia sp. NBC_01329]